MKPYYQHEGITIYHADCREVLPTLEPVALVLTDPPYGIPAGAAFVRLNSTVIADDGDAVHNVEVDGWRETIAFTDDAWFVEFGRNAPAPMAVTVAGHESLGFVATPSNLLPWLDGNPSLYSTYAIPESASNAVAYKSMEPVYGP